MPVLPGGATGQTPRDWPVAGATVRFDLEITAQPTEPCAGIIALLPDGGILPRPLPEAVVRDAAGRELRSECVWFNPQEGLGLVFEPPASGDRVSVYLRPAQRFRPWTPASKFCPSLLLYTQMDVASLEAAEQMGREYPPGRGARMGPVRQIGHMHNPFGRDDIFISYYTGWLKITAPGRYYFATISDEGSIARINSATVAEWPGEHRADAGRKGQFGTWTNLTEGLHRVEYFHFERTGPQQMQLVWRTPGSDPGGLPVTVPRSAFVHSGSARIVGAATPAGTAPAMFSAEPVGYLWLDARPMHLYLFRALFTESHPPDTRYRWRFEGGRQVEAKEFYWLFESDQARNVTLAVVSGGTASQCARAVYYDRVPDRATINRAVDRRLFREGLLTLCRAVAPPASPCADWSSSLWATLLGVVEPYEDNGLLVEIFQRSHAEVRGLRAADRYYLEDLLIDVLRYEDPEQALKWIERLQQEETDGDRKLEWALRRVELWLYELDDPGKARELALALRGPAAGLGASQLARVLIRLGDIERLSGNHVEAFNRYTEAQDLHRSGKLPAAPAAGASGGDGPERPRTLEEIRAQLFSGPTPGPAPVPGPAATGGGQAPRPEDWRAATVRVTTYHATVRNLVRQRFWYEARDALARWELEYPLSKLAGDYPLAEAEYFMAIGDCARVLKIVSAYRQGVELSNFLPDTMDLELNCLLKLERFDEIRALAADISKRFSTLPVAQKAADWVKLLDDGKTPGLRESVEPPRRARPARR
jgi:hypothetical protein